MHIYFVRHGQSEGNLDGDCSPSDPPLTELGHAQAARAGLALSGQGITALYTSPMMRAMQTAKALHEVLGLPMQVRVELAETYRPAWPAPPGSGEPIPKRGLTIAEARTMFSAAEYPEDIAAGEPWWEAHVRERREGAYNRAAAALAHLRARHEERDRIAIVTHGAFGSVLLSVALGCPPTDQNRFSQYNCALSLLEITEEGARLHHQNRVEHLPEGLRTDPT
ncbi:MAG TPA: histidine phosphatase family protein [Candidatus Hydrogenedentes bacterium]|nr:histidine phosphatase family protein [Candidatus Hydrogenedentota bacterium]